MISGLGLCEDPECTRSPSNHELVRLFRCAIHCDHLLCLYHLNAHNVYYEEEKKQNDAVVTELQNCLALYQTIFEQHILAHRDLVHQASSILLQNTSSIIPIEQIRPILEKLQKAVAVFQQEKVIIKCEAIIDGTEFDSNLFKDFSSIKKETNTPNKVRPVVRLERIDINKEFQLDHRILEEQMNRNQYQLECANNVSSNENVRKSKDSNDNITIESISSIPDDDGSKLRKSNEENQQHDNRRSQNCSPNSSSSSGKKKVERVKKKNEKTVSLKRLQT